VKTEKTKVKITKNQKLKVILPLFLNNITKLTIAATKVITANAIKISLLTLFSIETYLFIF